jgi:hydroxymethylbilane synthase
MAPAARHLRLATRGSPLARWQAERVAALLRGHDIDVALVVVETEGDRRREVPIDRFGGRGVFVREVQTAVTSGDADAAVHSAKDLPSSDELRVPGLVLAAVPERADPRDLLVGATLADLPTGARVATGSARRRAQLANLRPDLLFHDLRGNIGTRLDRVRTGDVTAVVVAKAAVDRLGWSPPDGLATDALPVGTMVPQVAQGALAVECRVDDGETLAALSALDDPAVRPLVEAERAFLAELGGGCTLPVGAHARWMNDVAAPPHSSDDVRGLSLTALVAAYDGGTLLRRDEVGGDPVAVGRAAARDLLDTAGGRVLLGVTE